MMPQAALIELFDRVASQGGAAVLIGGTELERWPGAAVAALKAQKLIIKAQPATSAVCPGCERECVMPVRTLPAAFGNAALFIVCDKRSDINRVELSPTRLTQWRTGIDAIAEFVAGSMSLRPSGKRPDDNGLLEIGIVKGDKRSQMLCLRLADELELQVGSSTIPLAEVVDFGDGRFSLNGDIVRQLVDSSTTADARYTPSNARREVGKLNTQARYKCWQTKYRELKKKHPNKSKTWCSQQIAKLDIAQNRSAETIRRHIKS